MFGRFLLVTLVTRCWMSPLFQDDYDKDPVILDNEFKGNLEAVQKELNAAAQEYMKKVDTSQYEDDSVYSQNLFPTENNIANVDNEAEHYKIIRLRNSLEDKEAILQHLHLIHNSDLDASDEHNDAMQDNFAEGIDEDSVSDMAAEIQSLIGDQNNMKFQTNSKNEKTKEKVYKITDKILARVIPQKTVNNQEFTADNYEVRDAANEIINNLDSLEEN